jgi:hypothetical protein
MQIMSDSSREKEQKEKKVVLRIKLYNRLGNCVYDYSSALASGCYLSTFLKKCFSLEIFSENSEGNIDCDGITVGSFSVELDHTDFLRFFCRIDYFCRFIKIGPIFIWQHDLISHSYPGEMTEEEDFTWQNLMMN